MPTSRARDKTTNSFSARSNRFDTLQKLPTLSGRLRSITGQFASFATTIQTRIDNGAGGATPSLNGSVEAQVERVLSQVLRQTSPAGATGYGGSVATALSPASGVTTSAGLGSAPGLPPEQAVLVGEAAMMKADLFSALDAVQALSVIAQAADISAYSSIVRAEVAALVEEFARPDQPRPARVRVLFGGLLGWAYAINQPPAPLPSPQLGDAGALDFLLDLGSPIVPSGYVEDQQALRDLITADTTRLLELWVDYQYGQPATPPLPPPMWLSKTRVATGIGGLNAVSPTGGLTVGQLQAIQSTGSSVVFASFASLPPTTPPPPSFSFQERMIRADLLLPAISHDCDQVAGALDAIGFGPGEQQTTPMQNLNSDVDLDLPPNQPFPIGMAQQPDPTGPTGPIGLTVKDVLDWASNLATGADSADLRPAGQLGLDLLADQADELFWIVVAMITGSPPPLRELQDAQVQVQLISLARDLSALADLCN
jgi:hypothetical protein